MAKFFPTMAAIGDAAAYKLTVFSDVLLGSTVSGQKLAIAMLD